MRTTINLRAGGISGLGHRVSQKQALTSLFSRRNGHERCPIDGDDPWAARSQAFCGRLMSEFCVK